MVAVFRIVSLALYLQFKSLEYWSTITLNRSLSDVKSGYMKQGLPSSDI